MTMSSKRKNTPTKLPTEPVPRSPPPSENLAFDKQFDFLTFSKTSEIFSLNRSAYDADQGSLSPVCDSQANPESPDDCKIVSSSETKLTDCNFDEEDTLNAAANSGVIWHVNSSTTLNHGMVSRSHQKCQEDDVMECIRMMIGSARTLDEKQQTLNAMIIQLQQLRENLHLLASDQVNGSVSVQVQPEVGCEQFWQGRVN